MKIFVLSQKLNLIQTSRFPVQYTPKKLYKNRVIVGIGGNIGNVIKRFESLMQIMKKHKRVQITKTSIILKNPPFGFLEQDYFYNTIIEIHTSMNSFEFLKY